MTYVDILESKKSELEAKYNMYLIRGDVLSAYNTLRDLMAYRCIDVNDARVGQKQYGLFKKAEIDPKHRFDIDYRKNNDFIPMWVYSEIPSNYRVQLLAEEHWGKRVEGSYIGDVLVEQREIKLEVRQCNTEARVKNAVRGMKELYKKGSGKVNKDDENLFTTGEKRIYTIKAEVGESIRYRDFGYIVISYNDGKLHAEFIVDNSVLNKCYIDIASAYNRISRGLKDELIKLGVKELSQSIYCDINSVYKKQLREKKARQAKEVELYNDRIDAEAETIEEVATK